MNKLEIPRRGKSAETFRFPKSTEAKNEPSAKGDSGLSKVIRGRQELKAFEIAQQRLVVEKDAARKEVYRKSLREIAVLSLGDPLSETFDPLASARDELIPLVERSEGLSGQEAVNFVFELCNEPGLKEEIEKQTQLVLQRHLDPVLVTVHEMTVGTSPDWSPEEAVSLVKEIGAEFHFPPEFLKRECDKLHAKLVKEHEKSERAWALLEHGTTLEDFEYLKRIMETRDVLEFADQCVEIHEHMDAFSSKAKEAWTRLVAESLRQRLYEIPSIIQTAVPQALEAQRDYGRQVKEGKKRGELTQQRKAMRLLMEETHRLEDFFKVLMDDPEGTQKRLNEAFQLYQVQGRGFEERKRVGSFISQTPFGVNWDRFFYNVGEAHKQIKGWKGTEAVVRFIGEANKKYRYNRF